MAQIAIDASDYECANAVSDAAISLSEITSPTMVDLRSGREYALAPTADVTPLEAVHCAILLLSAVRAFAAGAAIDWMAYVREHGLERHFGVLSK